MGKRTNTAQWDEKRGRWKLNVQKDGQRRSFYSGTPGRAGQREANAKADAWLDEGITGEGTRIAALYADYLANLKITTGKSNYEQVSYFGRCWILPAIGNRKIGRLTEQQLQEVINAAYAAGLSKKTISGIKATIMAFMKYCRKTKATTLFPENLSIPKGARTKEKRILQPKDLAKLFESGQTERYGKTIPDPLINAYRLQVLTGLRPGELLGLEWGDIDESRLTVRRSLNKYGEITQGKNENACRTFPLTASAKQALADQRRENPFGRIFGSTTQKQLAQRWRVYCRHNGIAYVSPYEMRHTFVSVAKTLPEGEIKPLVGHSRNMDTFGTYAHAINGEADQTAAKLEAIFTDILQSVV